MLLAQQPPLLETHVSFLGVLMAAWLAAIVVLFVLLVIKQYTRKIRLGGRVYDTIDKFVAELGAELGLKGQKLRNTFFVARVSQALFSGTLESGRAARLTFETDHEKLQKTEGVAVAMFAVSCESVPQLTVSLKSFFGAIGRALGLTPSLVAGEKSFDERYSVESLEPNRAKLELEMSFVREGMLCLLDMYTMKMLVVGRV
jgi:hypothetical protein